MKISSGSESFPPLATVSLEKVSLLVGIVELLARPPVEEGMDPSGIASLTPVGKGNRFPSAELVSKTTI